jgi:hypothetical protein
VVGLVGEDSGEEGTRLGIGVQHLPVEGEASGGDLLGEVEEGEERLIGLAAYVQILEATLAWSDPVSLETGSWRCRTQELAAPRAKELGVALLVVRVAQEEATKGGVSCLLGSPGEVTPALRLGLREAQELAGASLGIGPNPPVKGL